METPTLVVPSKTNIKTSSHVTWISCPWYRSSKTTTPQRDLYLHSYVPYDATVVGTRTEDVVAGAIKVGIIHAKPTAHDLLHLTSKSKVDGRAAAWLQVKTYFARIG